ncbi:MAG: Zonular occludens toxin [Oxalobacteraceae bacterium]|nr:MAG: Zonular occludens toxin [Oxalobacteraceae bacterium]
MPITLVTGLPGHAKTLYTLDRWRPEAEKALRPVFYNGIKGLNIPGWQEWEVDKWEDLPAGALFIVDEAQFRFPVTGRGQTPMWVQRLATHRHLGLDFVVITQDPMLLDSFVRKLVDRHFHVVRKFGLKAATIYESVNGACDNVSKPAGRKNLIRHQYRHNKEVYTWYQSAELHTVKARLPARFWLMCAMPFFFGLACWVAYNKLRPRTEAEQAAQTAGAVSPGSSARPLPLGDSSSSVASRVTMTAAEYVQAYTPRLEGLAHTAPIYDGVTSPQQAPYPAACIASAKRCQCYTQQGTRLDMRDKMCRELADGGFFVAWSPAGERVQSPSQAKAAAPPADGQVQPGQVASFYAPSPPQFAPAAVDPDAGSLPRRVTRAVR